MAMKEFLVLVLALALAGFAAPIVRRSFTDPGRGRSLLWHELVRAAPIQVRPPWANAGAVLTGESSAPRHKEPPHFASVGRLTDLPVYDGTAAITYAELEGLDRSRAGAGANEDLQYAAL
jgi:hypothetical protein